jgi:hypothetical protein
VAMVFIRHVGSPSLSASERAASGEKLRVRAFSEFVKNSGDITAEPHSYHKFGWELFVEPTDILHNQRVIEMMGPVR